MQASTKTFYLITSLLQLKAGGLARYAADDNVRGILGDDLVVVEHGEFLSGITAHEIEQGVGTTRVLVQPVGHVKDDALDDDPEVLLLVVLGNLFHGELLLGHLELGDIAGLGLAGSGVRSSGLGGSGSCHLAATGASTAPLNGDLAGGGRIDVERDLA